MRENTGRGRSLRPGHDHYEGGDDGGGYGGRSQSKQASDRNDRQKLFQDQANNSHIMTKPWRKADSFTNESNSSIMSAEAREAIERELQERIKGTNITSLWADDDDDDDRDSKDEKDQVGTAQKGETNMDQPSTKLNEPNGIGLDDKESKHYEIELPSATAIVPMNWRNSSQSSQDTPHKSCQRNGFVGARNAIELEEMITRHITIRMTPDISPKVIKVKLPRRS